MYWMKRTLFQNFQMPFTPFQEVEVKDVFCFQNSDNGHPIWLKVINQNGEDAIVRYNQQGGRVGIKDHYFTSDPLPLEWGLKLMKISKIEKQILACHLSK